MSIPVAMAQAAFEMDDSTGEALEQLMKFFKVKNRSQAIRYAIALAGAIAHTAKANTIIVRDENDNTELKILVAK